MPIPVDEVTFSFARSSGAGGQNVNKVNSKAQLHWDLEASSSVPAPVKERFRALHGQYLTANGVVTLTCQEHRSQKANMDACLAKLEELMAAARRVPKTRKKTKPTRGSVERRLQGKRRDSEKKRGRRGEW